MSAGVAHFTVRSRRRTRMLGRVRTRRAGCRSVRRPTWAARTGGCNCLAAVCSASSGAAATVVAAAQADVTLGRGLGRVSPKRGRQHAGPYLRAVCDAVHTDACGAVLWCARAGCVTMLKRSCNTRDISGRSTSTCAGSLCVFSPHLRGSVCRRVSHSHIIFMDPRDRLWHDVVFVRCDPSALLSLRAVCRAFQA